MQIIFKTPAVKDLQEIYEWYQEQSAGLGERFLDEIDFVIPYVLAYPKSFRKRYKSFRIVSLSHFPYLLFYTLEKETIFIHRISHAHRNRRKLQL